MDFSIFTEPQQGASYDDLLAVALRAEGAGFGAFFRSDHFLHMGDGDGLPGPTDAWVTLAGLARDTSTIRLGTLVSSATFRLPGPLAVAVAQVDQMSGGRVEFGLGSGWFAEEHSAFGITFPELGERFDRLEEQFEIITGMWASPVGQSFDHEGTHYQLHANPGHASPAQDPGPPIVVGGWGPRRTPALAARFASEYNLPFPPLEAVDDQFGRVRTACDEAGRDPAELTWSAALIVCCGSDDAEVARRAEAIGREVDELKENGIAGSPEECIERLGHFAAAGVERVHLQLMDLADLDHIDLVGSEVCRPLN